MSSGGNARRQISPCVSSRQHACFMRARCSCGLFVNQLENLRWELRKPKAARVFCSYWWGVAERGRYTYRRCPAEQAESRNSVIEIKQLFGTINAGMPLPVKRWSILAFVFASFAIASTSAMAAAEWQLIKVNGHDY